MEEADGGRWVPQAVEAEIVRSIYRWYTEDSLTITQIVDRLRVSGAQMPPRGKRWHFGTVMLEDLAAVCQKIQSSLVDPTPKVQQEVIRLLIDHIVVEKDTIVVKHIIPTDDDCRLLPGRRFSLISADFIGLICETCVAKRPGTQWSG